MLKLFYIYGERLNPFAMFNLLTNFLNRKYLRAIDLLNGQYVLDKEGNPTIEFHEYESWQRPTGELIKWWGYEYDYKPQIQVLQQKSQRLETELHILKDSLLTCRLSTRKESEKKAEAPNSK